MLIILIIFMAIGVMGGSAYFYITKYNHIQFLITKIEQAEGIIDETLRARYDLLLKTIKITKSKAKSSANYFKEVNKIKDQDISNFDFDREIAKYINLCETIKGDYPELNDNKDLKLLMRELKRNEEKLTATKNYYNRQTTEINGLIRKFPVNLIAIIHNIKVRPFFDGKDLTDDIIDDFKI